MGKLALGLTLIVIVITVFFIALMTILGIVEEKDLKQLKKVIAQPNQRRTRNVDKNKLPFQ
ncbi:hypothetical protein SAMN05421640_2628 [Ekhidna lutea]|uniref:Uncharacterized protein n=1 Tax=Ekhidna lutea TaxID=447679 RepID=A0A239KH63_EKHLU|nr:hypothetical protein [Ekhidna lutea]SNT16959.1 hypothetical protein SAMN05421640_2628 [Ekhidna lutea]